MPGGGQEMSLEPQAGSLWHQSPLLWTLQTLPTQGYSAFLPFFSIPSSSHLISRSAG